MKIDEIVTVLESFAPTALQESFDNCGLLVGNRHREATGVLLCVDVTESIVDEAIDLGCNMIVAHHPLIFKGIKKLNGQTYIERSIEKAIKNDLAIYAAHTNFDIVRQGVSWEMAHRLGLQDIRVLAPKPDTLCKVVTFVPPRYLAQIQEAVSEAGAGHIGDYDCCSYSSDGTGCFRALEGTSPFVGKKFEIHSEQESRVEWISPSYSVDRVVSAIKKVHPYEEPAIDVYPLKNRWDNYGLGVVGRLTEEQDEKSFLQDVKKIFDIGCIRHSPLLGRKIRTVALCGGSGADFIANAKSCKADIYLTSDVTYHRFFEANGQILIADIGHFESEQFTKNIFYKHITEKFPNFAVRFSQTEKNMISYF